MTVKRAHGWGAVIIGGGVLLSLNLFRTTPPASLAELLLAVGAYAALNALVLHWGLIVYGPPGALGALALTATTGAVLAGTSMLIVALALLAAAYVLMRCLLDPTVQWALLAGVTIAAVLFTALIVLAPNAMGWLVPYSLLLVVVRAVAAERNERRYRVLQAALVSILVAWAVAIAAIWTVALVSTLPTAEEYSRAESIHWVVAVEPAAAAWRWSDAPIVLLLLAACRPWRRQRRYSDAGWLLGAVGLGLPFWRATVAWAGASAAAPAVPFLALLAGAWWDAHGSALRRRVATAAVLMHVAAGLLVPSSRPTATAPVQACATRYGGSG
jgi:hypothetical protein